MTENDILNGTFIGELPDSDQNWQLVVTKDGIVVAINSNHPPHAVIGNKLVKVRSPFTEPELL